VRSKTLIVLCDDNSFPFQVYFSIQTEPYPCRQEGQSNDDPIFSQIHFHSFKGPTSRVLSALIGMTLTRIYAPSLLLRSFILVHRVDPQHGDIMPDIDQYVLAYSLTLNDAQIVHEIFE